MKVKLSVLLVVLVLSVIIGSYKVYACGPINTPPVAILSAEPDKADVNETVILDGSGSYDPDGYITKYEWDWTNNGSYDYNETPGDERLFPWVEDLGVQVLVTSEDFSLDMPLVNLPILEAGKKILLIETPPINLSGVKRLALTAQCTYSSAAKKPIRLLVVSSPDGLKFDTKPLYVFEHDLEMGRTVRETFELNTKVKYLKVLVENPDRRAVSDVEVIATLGS